MMSEGNINNIIKMKSLIEKQILLDLKKARLGVYKDTIENRRKHRVGQKYGAEKQSKYDDDPYSNPVMVKENKKRLELSKRAVEIAEKDETFKNELVKEIKNYDKWDTDETEIIDNLKNYSMLVPSENLSKLLFKRNKKS